MKQSVIKYERNKVSIIYVEDIYQDDSWFPLESELSKLFSGKQIHKSKFLLRALSVAYCFNMAL